MKKAFLIHCLAISILGLALFIPYCAAETPAPTGAPAGSRAALTIEQQQVLLKQRISIRTMDKNSFTTYADYMVAFNGIYMVSDYQQIKNAKLTNVFLTFYQPTVAEVLEAIARQTLSSYYYDNNRAAWVFAPPVSRLPFTITPANGWYYEDWGFYVRFFPNKQPAGMEIFILGRYSAEQDQEGLFKNVRQAWALIFLNSIDPKKTLKDMQEVKVDGVDALYCKTNTSSGVAWRQWVFVKYGRAFIIVNAIKKEREDAIKFDIKAMVESFRTLE